MAKEREKLDAMIGFSAPPGLKRRLERLAEREMRRVSDMARVLLTEAMDAREQAAKKELAGAAAD